MILRIDLTDELEDRLQQAAAQAGMRAEEFAARALEERLRGKGTKSALALLDTWSEEDATDDPAELAARRQSLEALKAALNANRPSERKHFP